MSSFSTSIKIVCKPAILAIAIGLVASAQNTAAQEDGKTNSNEIRVFFRVSKSFVERLMEDRINLNIPIDSKIQSIALTGKAVGSAGLNLELIPGRGNVGVVTTVNGKLDCYVKAKASLASAAAVYRSQFGCRKTFTFNGIDFGHQPSKTTASGTITLQQICSKRKGMLGRLIRRVINRVINNRMNEIEKLFQESVEKSISQQMNDVGDSFVKELNHIDRYAEMVKEYFPDVKRGPIQILTTKSHLLAGFGAEADDFPKIAKQGADDPVPVIEIWIRTRPIERVFLQLLDDWEVAHDLLKTYLPKDEAKKIADNLEVASKQGWTLVRVGVEKKSKQASRKVD